MRPCQERLDRGPTKDWLSSDGVPCGVCVIPLGQHIEATLALPEESTDCAQRKKVAEGRLARLLLEQACDRRLRLRFAPLSPVSPVERRLQ